MFIMEPAWATFALLSWNGLCAFQDARTGRISHWLSYPVMAAVGLYLVLTGHSLLGGTPANVLTALLLTLALTLPGYRSRRFGAGDLKMLLALSMASGDLFILLTIAAAALAMAVWAQIAPALWPRLPERLRYHLTALAPDHERLAYSPFLLIATTAVLTFTPRPLPGLIP